MNGQVNKAQKIELNYMKCYQETLRVAENWIRLRNTSRHWFQFHNYLELQRKIWNV